MKRVIGAAGVVHFRNPATPTRCLCGASAVSALDGLFGTETEGYRETAGRVTCPDCARVYVRVKDEPWNALDERVLMCASLHAADKGPWEDVPPTVDILTGR